MAISTVSSPPPYAHRNYLFISLSPFPVVSSLFFPKTVVCLQIRFLRRPRVLANKKVAEISKEEEEGSGERIRDSEGTEEEGVDWEGHILQDTAPLVGFVRMLLHSERYAFEGRLIPEHEKVILDKLLPYHPKLEEKIGCGIDFIRVGFHPDFEESKCLFVVRKDGESVDFSYWKCLKGRIRKKYPKYADRFLLKHFSKQQRRI